MADIDHHLLESSAAMPATTTSSVDDDEDDSDGGFTFSAASPLTACGEFADGRIGPVYPVFGRPRSLPLQGKAEEDPASSAIVRVPLAQLLLEERGSSSPEQQPDDDGELDGVPVDSYCLWSPGGSPPAAAGSDQSPARCQKSGSTGSVLRWLLGRSSSDSKEKFVYILNTVGSDNSANEGNGGRRTSFLPYGKKDLLGLFANAGAFRRSYDPF